LTQAVQAINKQVCILYIVWCERRLGTSDSVRNKPRPTRRQKRKSAARQRRCKRQTTTTGSVLLMYQVLLASTEPVPTYSSTWSLGIDSSLCAFDHVARMARASWHFYTKPRLF
jgi:hypothetical protein